MKATSVVTAAFCLLAACGGEREGVSPPGLDPGLPAGTPTGSKIPDPPPAGSSLAGSWFGGPNDNSNNIVPPDADPYILLTHALSEARCDAFVRCQDGGNRSLVEHYGSRYACIRNYETEIALRMALPGVGFTQDDVDLCAKRLAEPNACKPDPSYAECAFTGKLANDTACNDGAQCQSGHCKLAGACGVCAPRLTLDDDCSSDPTACGPTLFCSATTKHCTKLLAIDAACDDSSWCRDGLICHAGKCSPLVPEGGACTPSTCARGLDCIGGTCAMPPALVTRTVGKPCTFGSTTDVCLASRCDADTSACEAWDDVPPADVCE